MVETDGKPQPEREPKQAQEQSWAFLLSFALVVFASLWGPIMLIAETSSSPVVTEEMSKDEKRSVVQELLAEGDEYFNQKNYNLANATYESVFLLEPDNLEASQRIDRLKKQMLREGKSETQLVTRIYDSEIDLRVHEYLKQVKELVKEGKLGRARFTLQKLLLLDPLHEEAQKLYDEVNRKLTGGVS